MAQDSGCGPRSPAEATAARPFLCTSPSPPFSTPSPGREVAVQPALPGSPCPCRQGSIPTRGLELSWEGYSSVLHMYPSVQSLVVLPWPRGHSCHPLAMTLRSSVLPARPAPLRPAGGFRQLPGLCSLPPSGFMGTSLLSATSRCSWLILCTPCPSPRISPFSQQPASLCRGTEAEAAVWVLALLMATRVWLLPASQPTARDSLHHFKSTLSI